MTASTRKSFLAEMAALAASFRARIEAEVTGFDSDPAQIQARRKRAAAEFEFFVGTYFPHYVRSPHQSALHRYLFTRLPEIVASRKLAGRGQLDLRLRLHPPAGDRRKPQGRDRCHCRA